ncbi:hypothetical protein DSL92_08745 [Billgrantia gudaonensis]|uniref:Uncharacterized protein n=1 Tax=Billgrantia gudaonensis TaxID=376427 RepID=A0A432JGM7_9GAMM|nr:hypothetical protein DSL92_08745 [Halomonas gudaonensis]
MRWAATRFATSSSSPAHLASQPITLTSVEASLSADEAPTRLGDRRGVGRPDNPRDYLTIVEAGAPEGSHLDYPHPARLAAVAPHRMRWATSRFATSSSSRSHLASQPITLTPITATWSRGPIVPGGEFQVHWEGPDNPRDYITIVEAGAEESHRIMSVPSVARP